MRFQFVDVTDGRETHREEVALDGTEPENRLRFLAGHRVDAVICCAVSRRLQIELEACGMRVLAHTCGDVDEVVTACLQDRLTEEHFRMPGCRSLPDCAARKTLGSKADHDRHQSRRLASVRKGFV